MGRRAVRALSAGAWTFAPALLVLVSLAVYRPFLRDSFVLDDFIWLQAARSADAGAFFRDAFGFPARTPFSVPTPFWRPLVDAWFFLAWRLFGDNPFPYHVSNAVLHGANAALLAVLVRRLTNSRAIALTVALIWLLSPAYDYAVLWISEATELLATFFSFTALILFHAGLRPGRRWLLAPALAATALALLAKQSAATLPPLMGLIALQEARPLRRGSVLRACALVLPFALLLIPFVVLHYTRDYQTAADAGIYRAGPHALANAWDYLLRLAWPFTAPGAHAGALLPRSAAAAFLLAGAVALLLERRVLALAFLWTLLALAPYCFFPAGTESRYLYPAAAPFSLFVVVLAGKALGRVRGALPRAGLRTLLSAGTCAALLLLLLLLARETRARQSWLHGQAGAYAQMLEEVTRLCGPVPSGGRIEIVGSPTLDLFGESTRMAFGMRYPGVHVERPATLDSAASATCVVVYENGRYTRLTDASAGLAR